VTGIESGSVARKSDHQTTEVVDGIIMRIYVEKRKYENGMLIYLTEDFPVLGFGIWVLPPEVCPIIWLVS
jgi:hypothetical protein